MATRIAVINDDTAFLELMHELLLEEGYEAHCYKEGVAAYEQVRTLDPAAVILDIRMGSPETGWQVLELFKLDRVLSKKPIIVCSAAVSELQTHAPYLQSKGCMILAKPFDLDDLLGLLAQAVGRST
jgi:DNA-binding response OmpR family regulator